MAKALVIFGAMMMWEIIGQNEDGLIIYGKTDSDGKMRTTAIVGYPELDEYLDSLQAEKE
jgi:hypothetical protein